MRGEWGCDRRGLLAGLLGVLATATRAGAGEADRGVAALATRTFWDAGAARRLGRACASALAGTARGAATAAELETTLQRRLGWPAAGASPATFAEALRQRNQADFLAGRCLCVDGWVLSETEVEVYLLIAKTTA